MSSYIQRILEEYYDSTVQLNTILKNAKTLRTAAEREKENRLLFIQNILGKNTYRKFDNSGLFAPVPMTALKLTFKDFSDLNPDLNVPVEKVEKLIDYIHDKFYTYAELRYGENHNIPLRTNITFKTIDDIIDFFYNIMKAYTRIFRKDENEIVWKPIVKKFRAYLN